MSEPFLTHDRAAAPIVSIGECMVELSRRRDGAYALAYGGDTFNTAVYLARAGAPVAYATALGDDVYSGAIRALAESESVATGHIRMRAGRTVGLYIIETTPAGERSFTYWRDTSPAREVFDADDAPATLAAIGSAALVYLSGITLSLYSDAALDRLAAALTAARLTGTRVAVDTNFRPRGWRNDRSRARAVITRFLSLADLALPTFDDERDLFGDAAPEATIERLRALGVGECVVKLGAAGALVAAHGQAPLLVPPPEAITPVDTTAAGDSFNAGYLARRRVAIAPGEAALCGHRLAGIVIQHPGAIVPRSATDAVTWHWM
jgi:2-dehydro-3-deoxygluconokinase